MSLARKAKFPFLLFCFILSVAGPASAEDFDSGPADQSDPAKLYQTLLDQGLSYFVNEQDYAKAAECFQKALDINPKDPVARKSLRLAREKLESQIPDYKKIESEELDKAGQHLRAGQDILAVTVLRSLIEKNPAQDKARRMLGKLADKIQDRIKGEPEGSFQWHADQGTLSYSKGDYEDSVRIWEEARKLDPLNQEIELVLEQTRTMIAQGGKKPEPPAPKEEMAALPKEPEPLPEPVPAPEEKKPAAPMKEMASLPLPMAVAVPPEEAVIKEPVPAAPLPKPSAVIVEQETPVAVMPPPAPVKEIPEEAAPAPEPEPEPSPGPPAQPKPVVAAEPEPSAPPPVVASLPKEPEPSPEPPVPPPEAKPSEAPEPRKEPPEFIEAGRLAAIKDYPNSIRILTDYIRSHPTDFEAGRLLERVVEDQSRDVNLHYREGLLAYADGDFPKAFQEWQKVLKLNPDHPSMKKIMLKAFFNR
ncbi:MAG: hypothetical protein A2636_00320 [Elusimicrobia bacterium RIFCSPHIGHO2_01_FULL_64_10]|nr:MAG: hypothetical protein A2636_00320 [Elusimicrobia bacterium RIFCSPHIGHO2_01_FULL_64_10]